MSLTSSPDPELPERIQAAHTLYCELTGQSIPLRCHWQRAWCELLREGFTVEDVHQVVVYLQREIRQERRNVGALKLSNLLQLDRFEEDLNISRVRLQSRPRPAAPPLAPITAAERAIDPEQAVAALQQLKAQLRRRSGSEG